MKLTKLGKVTMSLGCFIYALLIGLYLTSYIVNIVKLCNQDFEKPYKNEVIHAVGLIPPCSVVTVWWP